MTQQVWTPLNLAKEFLSLNKGPCEKLRYAIQEPRCGMEEIRDLIIAALKVSQQVEVSKSRYGTSTERVSVKTTIKTEKLEIYCWLHFNRSDKLAPDGKKKMTYFADFYCIGVSRWN